MSFFIANLARKRPKRAAGASISAPRGGAAGKHQAATLNRIGCGACPLNKSKEVITPKMLPTLKKGGKIYFMAEAPGRDEDERSGRPLTGPSGSLLRECIPDEWEDECSFDNVINCFPGDTLISSPSTIKKVYRRYYSGAVIVLETMKGHLLTGTPNHPVLTGSGWVPMKALECGADLFSRPNTDRMSIGYPNIQNPPATFNEIFSAFSESAVSKRVVGRSMNFHGDGTESEVDVLETTSCLLSKFEPAFLKKFGKSDFVSANQMCGSAEKLCTPQFHFSYMSSGGPETALPQSVGSHPTSKFDVGRFKDALNDPAVDIIPSCESAKARAVHVSLDYVISVSVKHFDGHVFNLETVDGSYIANGIVVSNCRPPKNRNPEWNEIECCRPRRVEFVQKAKPLLIVGLGAIPLQAVLGSVDLQGMRGRLFAVKYGDHACWFLPTYHPSFILRIAKNKNRPLNSLMGHCFRMDLKRAFAYAEWLPSPEILDERTLKAGILCYDGTKPEHEDEVTRLLGEAAKADEKAVDLETKGLRPYKSDAAIMSFAFSFADIHFSVAMDHPRAGWTLAQKTKIRSALKAALLTGTKIAHNVPFEMEWLINDLGREIIQHDAWHCTQMECHFLDERRGKAKSTEEQDRRAAYQALEFLVKGAFGISYKSLFKLNKKDMSKSDLGETLVYNACDTKVTQMLHKWQRMLLKRFGLWEAYLEARPRQTSAAMMQLLGVPVDQAEVKRAQKKLGPEIAALEGEIAGLKVVKAYVKDHGEFNPLSTDDAIEIFKDYLHRPEVEIKPERYEVHDYNKSSASKKRYDEGKGTKYSVDKNVLDQIDHPLAQLIIDLRNRTKTKSTYVDDLEAGKGRLVYPDGLIHCNFNMTFAETGRTSSDDPNMQNYPKRNDEWVRAQVAAAGGYLLMAFDFGQLEACTAAMCSLDKVLIKALWEDYDIHMEWAERTAQLYPAIIGGRKNLTDKDVMKKFRSKIKNKLVFPAIFGAQNSSIAGYLDMPEDVIDRLMRDFWRSFHGLAEWQEKLMERYYEVGYVESPTGRRRHYPMTRNQAINDPIQSVACDIVCRAMNSLSELAAAEQKWHLHPILNIHDDLTFVVPDDDRVLEAAITDVYSVMLTPGYDFINVPLSVTGSIGKRWYGMQEIGKFWSHKDV